VPLGQAEGEAEGKARPAGRADIGLSSVCGTLHNASHSAPSERIAVAKLNEYVTVAEAAAYLGCSADTLRRRDRANKPPARRHPVTGYRLYLPGELDEFLREAGDMEGR